MKPQFPWDAIRFLYELHFVSERLFAVKLGIDRTWLKEKAKRECWQVDDALTLADMENEFRKAELLGNTSRAQEIRANIRMRSTAWHVAAETLRLSIITARKG